MNNQDNYTYEEVLELTKQGVEIWRRIVIDGIVFDYEVSNLGRIKSLKRGMGGSNGKRVGYGYLKNDGYMSKGLCYTNENGDKKIKSYLVHRLVATMFVPNPNNKPFVDHSDTCRNNNRVDNLRWVTRQENMNNDKTKKNMSKSAKNKTMRRLTDKEKYPYVTEENILSEEWKTIIGYEDIYIISNMGRIKSLGFRRNNNSRSKKGLLQPYLDINGYQRINLVDRDGKNKVYLVHRLVAEHFINNPNNHKVVDHINTNKVDNRHFNLRWTTQQENMNNDKTRKSLSKTNIRPIIVLDRNGDIISEGLGLIEAAKKIGVCENTLINLLKSDYPYRAKVYNGGDINSLCSLNGIRAFYLDQYEEEKVLKEISEDKTDYDYCMGDLVCVYTDGRISNPMSSRKLAKELELSRPTLKKIRDSKEPYKAPTGGTSKKRLEYLKTLEGIRIMYYEDYLKRT